MINLDDLAREDLRVTAETFRWLAKYCDQKEVALRYRAAGNLKVAQSTEAACERIYKGLPEWARW